MSNHLSNYGLFGGATIPHMEYSDKMDQAELVDSWLNKIESAQSLALTLPFPAGSIPSYRAYPLTNTVRPDPNVCFPALLAGKLLDWQWVMSDAQKKRSSLALELIRATFRLYKSRRGRMHYNFWPTTPDIPFPNGSILHRFDFFRLPDDIDDTALVFAAGEPTAEAVRALQNDIENHCRRFYSNAAPIYPVWLGDKMPFVADACALTNLLALFAIKGLAPTTFTIASGEFLTTVITDRSYIRRPYNISPYYPDPAIIAYHLSKWLAADNGAAGIEQKKFIGDVQELLNKEKNPFRAMLYSSSLLRLKVAGAIIELPQIKPWLASFPWFFGSMLSAVKPKVLRQFGSWKQFQIAHVCECWNYSLWIEYLLLNSLHKAETNAGTRPVKKKKVL